MISLTTKYHPRRVDELVLPTQHALHPLLHFLRRPYASAWLLTGKSGLGKSSLAEIMATMCSDPLQVTRFVGPNLDAHAVNDLELSVRHRPMYGNFHFVICDEADQITPGGQIRLLRLLEKSNSAIWVFTSNESIANFETRFLSRVKHLAFTSQGILPPATQWLLRIAQSEGLSLKESEAAQMVRQAKNNLRTALQDLELRLLAADSFSKRDPNRAKTEPKPALSILEV